MRERQFPETGCPLLYEKRSAIPPRRAVHDPARRLNPDTPLAAQERGLEPPPRFASCVPIALCSCPALSRYFAIKPGTHGGPVALHHCQNKIQRRGNFFQGETAKEAQFDDPALSRVDSR